MNTLKLGSKGEEVKHLQKHLDLYQDGIFGKLTEEAVKDFQKKHGVTADGIVGAKTWDLVCKCLPAETVQVGNMTRTTRPIKRIILHCSATVEGKDFTVEDIRRWHKEKGWADIGYHYVIYRNGSIMKGRSINLVGAHCSGYNTGSIGIVYIGGLAKDGKTAKDTRTEAQKQSLRDLVRSLKILYPGATVHGHNEFSSKACPSFNVQKEL